MLIGDFLCSLIAKRRVVIERGFDQKQVVSQNSPQNPRPRKDPKGLKR